MHTGCHICGAYSRTHFLRCDQRCSTQLEVFPESHLNHSLGRDSKDCQATRIRQPNTEEHVPLYGTTSAPQLNNAVILFKEQEQIPLLIWQEGICTVLKLGQQGIDMHDQGTAQQGAPASHTHPQALGWFFHSTQYSLRWDALLIYMVKLFIFFILLLPFFLSQ